MGTGDTFVVGEVDVIRDPDTGEVLDESMNEIARLQVQTVKEKLAICSVVSGNGAAVENLAALRSDLASLAGDRMAILEKSNNTFARQSSGKDGNPGQSVPS